MAIVGVNENKDNIDLMPMGWLNERGCEIEWAEQVSITTPIPHQRRLILGCWQGLPYLDVNQIDILLNDLPEAEDPGRSGTTATTRVQASRAVLGPRACAITSMLSKIKDQPQTQPSTPDENKRNMLDHLEKDTKDFKRLKKTSTVA